MDRDSNRLMLRLEQLRRTVNREIINPEIRSLTLEQLTPVVTMVAVARAAYIKAIFDLSSECEGVPSPEQIAELKEQRTTFTELVDAANALETAIARGYVDVEEAGAARKAS